MGLRCFLIQLVFVWIGGAVYSSNICKKSDIEITDPKVTVKSFTSSLDLTKDDIPTSKMVVGCPKGYEMRVDYAWTYQTYQQPNGNTLIEVNCSQLYALDKTQICYKGCSIPKVDNIVITPLPAHAKHGPSYSDGETIQVKCGEDVIEASCKDSVWTNLSDYHCPYGNTSSKSLVIILDTTTNMGEEIAQVYDIVRGIVDKLNNLESKPNINYVLVPFNDPDFYPMLVTINGSVMLNHLQLINQHGASGGKDCPELTLAAIQRGIKESYEGSEVFVFTDASSKEPERKDLIIKEATRKRIKINFVLTGHCGDNQMNDQVIYQEIAESTSGFMVNLEKTQIREMYSVIDASLMRSEDVTRSILSVQANKAHVVKVPCDKTVHRMTISVACTAVRIISLNDDKDNDVRYHHVSTLRDMMTIMVQPSLAEYVLLNISCGERGSALVTATSITDINFQYVMYDHEVDSSLSLTDIVDMKRKNVVFASYTAAVYDVSVTVVVLDHESRPIIMKKYLGGYIAEIEIPSFVFHLEFNAKYSGQSVQRLSSPIIPRIGCEPLNLTAGLIPSTLESRDQSRVRFSCESECYMLSHNTPLTCEKGEWSQAAPVCEDAGYTCKELIGPGNGTILYGNHVVYNLSDATCGQTVEVHCNTYFELEGAPTSACTPEGWTSSVHYCRAVKMTKEDPDSATATTFFGEWWIWVVISATTIITLSVLFSVICILVIKRGKRKTRVVQYTTAAMPHDDDALDTDEDIYEVVDCNGNYPPGGGACQPLCNNNSLRRTNRPPMPPPLSTNSYGNLPSVPNMPPNPLYSHAGPINEYLAGNGDIRSTSMVYEEMRNQVPAPTDESNSYDYATGRA